MVLVLLPPIVVLLLPFRELSFERPLFLGHVFLGSLDPRRRRWRRLLRGRGRRWRVGNRRDEHAFGPGSRVLEKRSTWAVARHSGHGVQVLLLRRRRDRAGRGRTDRRNRSWILPSGLKLLDLRAAELLGLRTTELLALRTSELLGLRTAELLGLRTSELTILLRRIARVPELSKAEVLILLRSRLYE
jgi:hypothetical protein